MESRFTRIGRVVYIFTPNSRLFTSNQRACLTLHLHACRCPPPEGSLMAR